MIYPKFIKKGDVIGVPAPSDGAYCEADIKRYKNAQTKLENLGYKTDLSENLFKSERGRSASSEERANEINSMFENPNINMILCATGGEFLTEIVSLVDYEKLVKNPKFIEGFSDPTGLLFPITTKYDIATIYGTNFKSFGMEEFHSSLNENLEILQGNLITQHSFDLYENERPERITGLEGYNLTDKVYWKILGDSDEITVKGRVFAGCMDLIEELAGTKYDGSADFNERYKNDGIIWCFDDCDLSKEQIIRSLWKLNELGFFKYTTAVIFGRCGNENTYIGYDMENCLKDSIIAKYGFPIIYDADISHKGPSLTIINGAIAEFKVKKGKAEVNFELK